MTTRTVSHTWCDCCNAVINDPYREAVEVTTHTPATSGYSGRECRSYHLCMQCAPKLTELFKGEGNIKDLHL